MLCCLGPPDGSQPCRIVPRQIPRPTSAVGTASMHNETIRTAKAPTATRKNRSTSTKQTNALARQEHLGHYRCSTRKLICRWFSVGQTPAKNAICVTVTHTRSARTRLRMPVAILPKQETLDLLPNLSGRPPARFRAVRFVRTRNGTGIKREPSERQN